MISFLAQQPLISLAAISFLANIPCGYIRGNHPKFSFKWFLWIHASIPLIVYLRLNLGTANALIPLWIILAIWGQVIGSRIRRGQMTADDQEKLNQIKDLKIPNRSYQEIKDQDVMVTLLNMGGPRTNAEVRDFLRRIFLDPYIIRFPLSQILQPVFAWLLVTFRAQATRERYQLIGGSSPITESTQKQVAALKREFQRRGRTFDVTYSFNYSEPLPATTIQEVQAAGKKYILPLSLYPHYSAATTGSNMHYLRQTAANHGPVTFLDLPEYYLHDRYVQAFADRIKEQIKPGETLDDFYLLFSAHGLPLYFLVEGDPYPFQIAQTTAKILAALKRSHAWSIAYQSDVGPLQWLKPSTESALQALARRGVKKLLVVPVSFVTDHIETLCEIDIEYRAIAEQQGITDFRMSRALECHPGFITALADSVEALFPQATVDKKVSPAAI